MDLVYLLFIAKSPKMDRILESFIAKSSKMDRVLEFHLLYGRIEYAPQTPPSGVNREMDQI